MGYRYTNGGYVITMKMVEAEAWMTGYLTALKQYKNKDLKWDIEMTTKKNPKQTDYKQPDAWNHYTLFLIDKGTNEVYMKSKELPSSSKLSWSSEEFRTFVNSLTKC